MTRNQRITQRKRKERNQKVWWYVTDALTLLALLATVYAIFLISRMGLLLSTLG